MSGMSEEELKNRYEMHLIEGDLWLVPYIGRKVNDRYDELFDHNGYYPSDEYDKYPEYSEKEIILNLHPHVKDGVIEDITYYKKIDNGLYSRHSIEKPLTQKDRKIFVEVLDECTDSVAGDVLDSILNNPLSGGWSVKSASEKNIVIQNGSEKISIPRAYVEFVIDVGRTAPDILNNRDFWRINGDSLRTKYMEGLMILLESFNKDNYPELIVGKTAKEKTEHDNNVQIAKESITDAILNDNQEKIEEYCEVLSHVPSSAIEAAVDRGDLDLVKRLSPKANPDVIERIGINAIDTSNKDLLELLVNVRGALAKWTECAFINRKEDALTFLLIRHGLLRIRENEHNYTFEELLPLVKYSGVAWPLDYLKRFYEMDDRSYITTALRNLKHTPGYDGYNDSDLEKIVDWVLDCKDPVLLDAVKSSRIVFFGQGYEDLFIKAFINYEEQWDSVKFLFPNIDAECIRSYWSCVVHNNYDVLERLINFFKIGTPKDLVIRSIDPMPKDKRIPKLIIENYDENIEPDSGKNIKIWHVFVRCKDSELFKLFFTKQSHLLDDEDVLDDVAHSILWYYPDVEKARFLAEKYDIDSDYVKMVALASKISLMDISSKTSEAVRNKYDYYCYIGAGDAEYYYIDDKTWEMEGSVVNPRTGRKIEYCTRETLNDDGEAQFEIVYLR